MGKWGEWCRNLPLSEIYADLDGGDRVCRVTYAAFMKQDLSNAGGDEAYEAWFSGVMTKEEYDQRNYESCQFLKRKKEW